MVDMEPREGRILMRKAGSLAFYPWYERGGIITKVAGKRVYYLDHEGKEAYTHEFSAICDTTEESDALICFSEAGKVTLQQLRDKLDARLVDVLAPLQAPSKKRTRSKAEQAYVETSARRRRRAG